MVGPLEVLSVCSAATTTVAEEDIDGWPAGGAVGESTSGHHRLANV
jgi:hypothetical protein